MDPVTIAAIVGAGASAAGAGVNAYSTQNMNRRSMEFSKQMYDRQFNDNLRLWHQQNAYNSPSAQMERLREAGLNPAMLYGGSGSAGQAGSISSPDVKQPEFRTPEWGNIALGAGSLINQMYDLDIKQAQVDNMRADNTVKLSQAALLAAQTNRSEFDLNFESEMREISAEARRESLRQAQISNQYQLDENERRAAMNAQSIQESAERVLLIRAQRANTEEDKNRIIALTKDIKESAELKRLDKELKAMDIQPSDPKYIRILGRMLYRSKGNIDKDMLIQQIQQGSNGANAVLEALIKKINQ